MAKEVRWGTANPDDIQILLLCPTTTVTTWSQETLVRYREADNMLLVSVSEKDIEKLEEMLDGGWEWEEHWVKKEWSANTDNWIDINLPEAYLSTPYLEKICEDCISVRLNGY